MSKRAKIMGITAQEASYLAGSLVTKGYAVCGLDRRTSTFDTGRIDRLFTDPHEQETRILPHYADLLDGSWLITLPGTFAGRCVQPRREEPRTCQLRRARVDRRLHGLALNPLPRTTRMIGLGHPFYHASSPQMFGATPRRQHEEIPYLSCNRHGAAKVYKYWITHNFRYLCGMFAINAIPYKHESPRRGQTCVTRKITLAVARIKSRLENTLLLVNVDAVRYPEYVEATRPSGFRRGISPTLETAPGTLKVGF